jgi:hypothetical protein
MLEKQQFPHPRAKSLNKVITLLGITVGYYSWGIVQGLERFPSWLEVPLFAGLYVLVAESLGFSIIFYFGEQLGGHPPKKINTFCNAVVATYAALSLILALATHRSPI